MRGQVHGVVTCSAIGIELVEGDEVVEVVEGDAVVDGLKVVEGLEVLTTVTTGLNWVEEGREVVVVVLVLVPVLVGTVV